MNTINSKYTDYPATKNKIGQYYMKYCFALIVLIVTAFTSYSREISGTIYSEPDSVIVSGASCRLYSGERLIIEKMTTKDGRFNLVTDIKSPLTLKIVSDGFIPSDIIIDNKEKNIDLGDVFIIKGTMLDAVSVSSNAMVDTKGRTIIYPSESEAKASTSAIDLLQKLPLPGLDANPIQRSFSVDGSMPMILIDGVPSSLADYNSLQPKDIKRIEYSRITPPRYANKNVNGFISITLKKRNDGGSFYGWMRSAVNTAFLDANIRATYHQGASRFSVYYQPQWRNYQDVYDNKIESYIGNDIRIDKIYSDRNPFNYLYNVISAKYDFAPNERTLFSVQFNAVPTTSSRRVIGKMQDSVLGDYDVEGKSSSRIVAPSLDLYLRHNFNDKNTIDVQVVGTISTDKYKNTNKYIYKDAEPDEDEYVLDANSYRKSLISEIVYSHDFSQKTSLSGGFQNTISHSRNKYITTDYEPTLTENNNYVYASIGQLVGSSIYLNASTGAKLFWLKNDKVKRHFIRNISSIQASWSINRKWNVQASFNYSRSIPSLSQITDYMQQISPDLFSNGSSNLKDSESFNYSLSGSFSHRNMMIYLYTGILNTNNPVFSDISYLGNGKFLSQAVNGKRRRVYQGDLNFRISDIYGFGFNGSISLCRYESVTDYWNHHLTSLDGSIYIWWNKGPFTISYWKKFPGKHLNGHYVGKDENGDMLSFSFAPDNHWKFEASWMYMFDKKGTQYPGWGYSPVNPSINDRYIKNNANMIVLSFSYSGEFGSIFRSARKSLNNSDNESSLLKN